MIIYYHCCFISSWGGFRPLLPVEEGSSTGAELSPAASRCVRKASQSSRINSPHSIPDFTRTDVSVMATTWRSARLGSAPLARNLRGEYLRSEYLSPCRFFTGSGPHGKTVVLLASSKRKKEKHRKGVPSRQDRPEWVGGNSLKGDCDPRHLLCWSQVPAFSTVLSELGERVVKLTGRFDPVPLNRLNPSRPLNVKQRE